MTDYIDMAAWRETESWEAKNNIQENGGEGKDATWMEEMDREEGCVPKSDHSGVEGQRHGHVPPDTKRVGEVGQLGNQEQQTFTFFLTICVHCNFDIWNLCKIV